MSSHLCDCARTDIPRLRHNVHERHANHVHGLHRDAGILRTGLNLTQRVDEYRA